MKEKESVGAVGGGKKGAGDKKGAKKGGKNKLLE